MKKPLFVPFTLALLLATTVVLASAAELLSQPLTGVPSPRSKAIVRAYYAAVSYFLETGDLEPVRSIVTPALLDSRELDASGDGLERYLRSLRQTFPDLLLKVDRLEGNARLVTTQLRIQAGRQATFEGIQPVNHLHSWLTTETLLIEGDRIGGRSSTGPGIGLFLAQPGLPVSLPVALESRVMVVRFTLEADAEHFVFVPAPAVLVLEHGEIRVLGNGAASIVAPGAAAGETTKPGKISLAGAGDTIIVSGRPVAVSGSAGQGATMLALLVLPTAEIAQFSDRHSEPNLLVEALKRPAGGGIGDGIVVTPIHQEMPVLTPGSVSITAGWAVLDAGGAVNVGNTAHHSIAVPVRGAPAIDHGRMDGELTVRNLEATPALAWVALVT